MFTVPNCLAGLVEAYIGQKRMRDARVMAQECVAAMPKSSRALALLGVALLAEDSHQGTKMVWGGRVHGLLLPPQKAIFGKEALEGDREEKG